jgi:hypothetical protein
MESETPRPRGVKCRNEKVADIFTRKIPETVGENPDFAAGRADAAESDPFGVGELAPEDLAPAPFPQKIPAIECEKLCRRMAAYLHGWCANGIFWILAAEFKRRFAARTGYSWRHIDDIFPQFQSYTTEFVFNRARLGRSWCILIHPKNRKNVLTLREARARLVGAIRSFVSKARGRVGIGRKFLENFHAITGLAPEHILRAWQSLRRIDGLSAWWGGRKTGRKFYVEPRPLWHGEKNSPEPGAGSAGQNSYPEIARGISPPSGGIDQKTAAKPQDSGRSSGSLRSQPGEVGGEAAGSVVAEERPLRDTPPRPGWSSSGDVSTAPAGAAQSTQPPKPGFDCHGFGRWKPARKPFRVGDRWVSAAKLQRKANFLAFGPLQNLHRDSWRVRFRPTTIPNFARSALEEGFADWQICAAYRRGLDACHQAAAKDQAAAENLDYWRARERVRAGEIGVREPSQAVAVAWEILRGDGRAPAERWAALFRGEVCPQKIFPVEKAAPENPHQRETAAPGARAAAKGGRAPGPTYRTIAPGLRVRSQASPEVARVAATNPEPALLRALSREGVAAEKPLRTIEAYIKTRGLTMAELFQLPRPAQAAILAEARAWQKAAP